VHYGVILGCMSRSRTSAMILGHDEASSSCNGCIARNQAKIQLNKGEFRRVSVTIARKMH